MTAASRVISGGLKALVLFGCLLLLTGWRFGPPLTFFEEEGAIARAIDELRAAGGFERVMSIDVAPGQVQIEAQDPNRLGHVNRWRLVKNNIRSFNWEEIEGPEPVEINMAGRDLEDNLFNLSDVDFAAAQSLMKEALTRAALEDPGTVESMDIRRTLFLIPKRASGDVRWAVRVRSGRESARLVADAKGHPVRMDIDGTNRAKNFDLLASLDRLDEAAQTFATSVGTDPILVEVRVSSRDAIFETNAKDTSPLFKSLKQNKIYAWNLNGLDQRLGSIDTSSVFGAKPTFGISDVDWPAAAKLVQKAKDALEMQDGTLSGLEVEKPGDQPGTPKVEWQITLKDRNGEEGTARLDAGSGEVLGLLLPESRRKPFDARDPSAWPGLLAKIEAEFGADGSMAELLINENHVAIVAADPRKREELAEFLLDDEGIKRFGTVSPFAEQNPRFTIADIRALTGEQMKTLIDATNARLGLPTMQIVNITISKASLDPSPQGNVTVEIRAEEAPFKRSGRVNWEIDGREIKAYLP
jgi:hypothetical protein